MESLYYKSWAYPSFPGVVFLYFWFFIVTSAIYLPPQPLYGHSFTSIYDTPQATAENWQGSNYRSINLGTISHYIFDYHNADLILSS